MCGICGKVYFDRKTPVSERLILRMCDVLQHRGPDEYGVYTECNAGFGHRRLSIVDLSGGKQPMLNARKDIWLSFNGEIYNFQTLRKDLENQGYTFHTHSDTEVLLSMYERYGTHCVKHLRGMFAFAIWDKRRQRLLLARDRIGQKPLFYQMTERSIRFSSEIKALLVDKSTPNTLNVKALSQYLTYQYVPSPRTIFQEICKLPPAHILVCENGKTVIERYWDLAYTPKQPSHPKEVFERAQELIQEAVKIRMIGDVPIGAFLSGGIDSSLVVAIMAQYAGQAVKTFSIGFEEKRYNELPYARMVAEQYQTEHQEFIVKPNALEVLPKLIWHFEEPFGDPASIPTYYLSQLTSQYVKVALNGDGGDESFGGYQRYLGHRRAEFFSRIPLPLRRSVFPSAFQKCARIFQQGSVASAIRYGAFLNEWSLHSKEWRYLQGMMMFDASLKRDLFTDDVWQHVQRETSEEYMSAYFHAHNAQHFTDKMLYADVMTYLPGALLVKIDRMTMAFGLEGRSPFLDHKLMEFSATLPVEYKVRGACLKYLLKQLGRKWLPQQITDRRKQGFLVPLSEWFRNDLRDFLHDILSSSYLAQDGVCKQATMQRILEEHQTGVKNHPHRIWGLLNLELWYRMFIRNA